MRFAPDTPEAAHQWVRDRLAATRPFAIAGGRTWCEPQGDELDTRGLDTVNFFEPDDMVIGIGAGLRAVKLREHLQAKGMALPAAPWRAASTVGGMVATNAYGPECLWGGGLRDAVIGMTYINGQGDLVSVGGRVVKNVTGYDLSRMMIGSLGGLGLILSVNFKLNPLPVEPHSLLWRDAAHWPDLVRRICDQRLPVDWLQVIIHDGEPLLGLGVSGNVARRTRLIGELPDARVTPDGGEHGVFTAFAQNRRTGGFLDHDDPGGVHIHLTAATSGFLTHHDQLPREGSWRIHPIGGDAHWFAPAAWTPEQAIAALQSWRQTTNGGLTLVRGATRRPTWPHKPAAFPLMQRLKHQLDPTNLFQSHFYDAPKGAS